MKKGLAILLICILVLGTVLVLDEHELPAVYASDYGSPETLAELEEVFSDLFENQYVDDYGLRTYTTGLDDMIALEDTPEVEMAWNASDTEPKSMAPATGTDSSKTNVQVEGVDESDIAKTDGEYIYLASEHSVRIYDSDLNKVGQIKMEEKDNEYLYISCMYVDEKKVTLIIDKTVYDRDTSPAPGLYPTPKIGEISLTSSLAMADSSYILPYIRPGKSYAEIYTYDVSDIDNIALIGKYGVEGHISQTRKIGDIVYLVSTYYPRAKDEILPLVLTKDKDTDGQDIYSYQDIELPCIRFCPGEKGTGYSIITAMDTAKDETNTRAIVQTSGQIYMNQNALFLTEYVYDYEYDSVLEEPIDLNSTDDTSDGTSELLAPNDALSIADTEDVIWENHFDSEKTKVIRFSIDGMEIGEGVSGLVPGTILNQFSMDEYNGYFRIATTRYDNDWNALNNIYVLDSSSMQIIGQLEGLAKGENIYSVRFMGDIGYMVTFETIDPLFVIDLSDPSEPIACGELKVPGFSNYLHPISDKYLLGIGQDTQEVFVEDRQTGDKIVTGIRTNGLKISLFNIEDMKHPTEEDVYYLGYNGSYSDVTYNHKALLAYDDIFGFDVVMNMSQSGDYDEKKVGFLFTVTDKITPLAELSSKGWDWSQNSKESEYVHGDRLLIMDGKIFYLENSNLTSFDLDTYKEIKSIRL